MEKIYLDNNATTSIDPQVLEVVQEALRSGPANPSSVHAFGREARNQLTKARRQVASLLGVRPMDCIFTSGATEALNLVLRGLTPSGEIISSPIEHVAVTQTLEALGARTKLLDPGSWGAVRAEQVYEAITDKTRAIVLMGANNETGVRTDIEGIAAIAEERGVPFIVDGVALLGKELFEIPPGVSAICFSGHKFHAPAGIGLAVVRQQMKLAPQITGGPQEHERRGGTENLAGILGFAKALDLALDEQHIDHMKTLRDQLERGVLAMNGDFAVNGEGPRICNTTNIAFGDREGEALLMNLDLEGIAVSHGSACSSGSLEPSRVLLGMGYDRKRAAASLRFSVSRFTTEEEIDRLLTVLSGL